MMETEATYSTALCPRCGAPLAGRACDACGHLEPRKRQTMPPSAQVLRLRDELESTQAELAMTRLALLRVLVAAEQAVECIWVTLLSDPEMECISASGLREAMAEAREVLG
jgi:hypothetical protein